MLMLYTASWAIFILYFWGVKDTINIKSGFVSSYLLSCQSSRLCILDQGNTSRYLGLNDSKKRRAKC